MAYSKIVFNGTTLMDLTQDTVAANNLISPNTAHDAAGLPVTGTASGGANVPTFMVTWDGGWANILSVTCDKTYSECDAIYSAGEATALAYETNGLDDPQGFPLTCGGGGARDGYSYIFYTASFMNGNYIDIEVRSNGTVIGTYPSIYNLTLNATANDTYYPMVGLRQAVYTEVNVNVPTGTARTSSDITAFGATVTVPAGLYSEQATKTIASGTEGTPSATKGTVSNHSVSITPSVTNTTGYITGGTKTGTAVSVSASELVSGTYTVDSSGTKDVTNYASASVAAGTAGTPSAAKGTVSNHQVSVTPSVTNTTGWITGSTKNGTAVTVTASELASGNKAISANGTNIDVVGYSTVSVAVPFSTIYTGSSNPSSSTGANGDIYVKTAN